MIRIIGLTGPKGSGKSTLAGYITQLDKSEHTVTMSFATPLKMACHLIFGGDTSHWFGNRKEEILPHLGKTPRELMQKLGTDFVRDMIDPELWVKLMRESISGISAAFNAREVNGTIILDDVRFLNEALMIKSLGGEIYQINLDTAIVTPIVDANVHPSERGIEVSQVDTFYTCAHGDKDSLRNIANRIYKAKSA